MSQPVSAPPTPPEKAADLAQLMRLETPGEFDLQEDKETVGRRIRKYAVRLLLFALVALSVVGLVWFLRMMGEMRASMRG
jgi:hypothetical protein